MTRATPAISVAALLVTMLVAGAEGELNVPLTDFRLGIAAAIETEFGLSPYPDWTQQTAYVAFTKPVVERRLLALEAKPPTSPAGARAIAIRHRIKLIHGRGPRLAVLVFYCNLAFAVRP